MYLLDVTVLCAPMGSVITPMREQKLLKSRNLTHRIPEESFVQLEFKVLLQETGISSGEPSEFLQNSRS